MMIGIGNGSIDTVESSMFFLQELRISRKQLRWTKWWTNMLTTATYAPDIDGELGKGQTGRKTTENRGV